MSSPIELVLDCKSWQQAQAIADELLGKKLIASAEFLQVDGIKLIMSTAEHLFDDIEAELKKLTKYETKLLQQIPLAHPNTTMQHWVRSISETGK